MYNGKPKIVFLFILFILIIPLMAEEVKYPNVAGAFYPLKTEELETIVDNFINKAKETADIKGKIYGILVPHAGYIYSGAVAGYGYKVINDYYDYVILLATSHTSGEYGLLTCPYNAFVVPNGRVNVDKKLLKKLIKKSKFIKEDKYAFIKEHAVEVQLPFLLKKLKVFKLLPFVVSNIEISDAKKVAEVLYDELKDKRVLIVISTDLSHYPPSFIAEKADKEIIDAILSLDSKLIKDRAYQLVIDNIESNLQTSACGEKAIIAGVEILKKFGADKSMLLKYSHSGMISGDNSRVVGYAAIVFYSEMKGDIKMGDLDIKISNELKKRLLKHARQAIYHYLKTGEVLKIKDDEKILDEYFGVFVTLKKNDELRGCIGMTEPLLPLREGIPHFACSAAFNDPRFYPVKENELKEIDLEISILSKPQKIKNIDEIIMKKHGVIVKKGNRSGLFLPQVAEETGWNKEEFLSNLCSHKAGLPSDAWKKDKDIEIFIFTVYAFSEKELK